MLFEEERISMDKRVYGLDVLRFISMCGIICVHILGAGGLLDSVPEGSCLYWGYYFLQIIVVASVDIFALLSGYLGYGKERLNGVRFIELIRNVLIYSFVITGLFTVFYKDSIVGIRGLIKEGLFPSFGGGYWYITNYIPLYLFAPYLNRLINILSKRDHRKLCVLLIIVFSVLPSVTAYDLFVLNRGYSFVWLVICYILGAFLKRVQIIDKRVTVVNIIFLPFIILCGNVLIYQILGYNLGYMNSYISPITLGVAIAVFILVKDFNPPFVLRKIVMLLSCLSFDVYIIHCHLLIYNNLISDSFVWISDYPIILIPIVIFVNVIAIYLVCVLIASIKNKILKFIKVDLLYEKIGRRISYTIGK